MPLVGILSPRSGYSGERRLTELTLRCLIVLTPFGHIRVLGIRQLGQVRSGYRTLDLDSHKYNTSACLFWQTF